MKDDDQVLIFTTEKGVAFLELADIPVRRVEGLQKKTEAPLQSTHSQLRNGTNHKRRLKYLNTDDLSLGHPPPENADKRHALWVAIEGEFRKLGVSRMARSDMNEFCESIYRANGIANAISAYSALISKMCQMHELRKVQR